jgi:hypothetical protein
LPSVMASTSSSLIHSAAPFSSRLRKRRPPLTSEGEAAGPAARPLAQAEKAGDTAGACASARREDA